jgi:iron complex outermembrane receptor protein
VDGEQRNRGFELDLFGEAARGIRLLGGLAFIDAVQTKTANGVNNGKRALGVPEWQANLGAEFDIQGIPGLTISGRAIYTGSAYNDVANTQKVPAWTRCDLGMRYDLKRTMNQPITLRAAIQNVMGKDYWIAAGGYLTQGSPRTFLLSATVDF